MWETLLPKGAIRNCRKVRREYCGRWPFETIRAFQAYCDRARRDYYPYYCQSLTRLIIKFNAMAKKLLGVAFPLHFRLPELSLTGGVGMKLRACTIGLGVVLLLGTVGTLAPKASSQEAAVESAKRKVKTKVTPEFPALAKQMNVTGKVKIEATISTDGRVTNTKVVGGSPLLVSSAVDALKRWRFEAAPKETTEIIEFDFN